MNHIHGSKDRIYAKKEECSGCGACANICPKGCITMVQDSEGFLYPVINKVNCINCQQCIKVCPFKEETEKAEVIKSYACFSCSEDERLKSSSGAIFALLAKKMIEDKGIVFGTSMTTDCRGAIVTVAEDVNSLAKLLGSKYLQSNTGLIFSKVRDELNRGRRILFSGTPCQINGLKKFLGKEYNNLLCVEIICHGVPSPGLWKKYVDYVEVKRGGKMTGVDFRCKEKNWHEYGMKEVVNGEKFFTSKDDHPFMQMFLRNYCLRPSCYNCKAKKHRLADMTLGDFWGVADVMPDMNDNKGVSLVIIRTEKGLNMYEAIKEKCRWKECRYDLAIKQNAAEQHSVPLPVQRATFFNDMELLPFDKLIKKYLGSAAKKKIKFFVKKILAGVIHTDFAGK